jgi:hypothetical protein
MNIKWDNLSAMGCAAYNRISYVKAMLQVLTAQAERPVSDIGRHFNMLAQAIFLLEKLVEIARLDFFQDSFSPAEKRRLARLEAALLLLKD